MTTVKLKKIDAEELQEFIPARDYAEIMKTSEDGMFFTAGSISPDYTSTTKPFPVREDKEDFVGLESAIRKCKRVCLFSKIK